MDSEKQIFVNHTVKMGKIDAVGFDLDYTLAEYKSPIMEREGFNQAKAALMKQGFPIANCYYKESFPIRGLTVDKKFGNLLKLDFTGRVLVASHGFHFLTGDEIEQLYPNKFVSFSSPSLHQGYTHYSLPDSHLFASMVDYYEKSGQYVRHKPEGERSHIGFVRDNQLIKFETIYAEIQTAMRTIHMPDSEYKKKIRANLSDFIVQNPRIANLLTKLRSEGKQVFLLTNSGYNYTKDILIFLLGPNWQQYFDFVIVNAQKPAYFAEGTMLRLLSSDGQFVVGTPIGELKRGVIYSGGSHEAIRKLIPFGKNVLYVGDHIFGDVQRAKELGWQTYFIIPELPDEISMAGKMASATVDTFGSCLHNKTKSRKTILANLLERFADLYATNCSNLLNYAPNHTFRPSTAFMAHELALKQIGSKEETNDDSGAETDG